MNEDANITTAIVNTADVCARFQPNSASSGATKTLHAYSVPSASVISSAPNSLPLPMEAQANADPAEAGIVAEMRSEDALSTFRLEEELRLRGSSVGTASCAPGWFPRDRQPTPGGHR